MSEPCEGRAGMMSSVAGIMRIRSESGGTCHSLSIAMLTPKRVVLRSAHSVQPTIRSNTIVIVFQ